MRPLSRWYVGHASVVDVVAVPRPALVPCLLDPVACADAEALVVALAEALALVETDGVPAGEALGSETLL